MVRAGVFRLQGAQQLDEGGSALVPIGVGVQLVARVPERPRPGRGYLQRRHPLAVVAVNVTRGAHLRQAAENRPVQHQLEVPVDQHPA